MLSNNRDLKFLTTEPGNVKLHFILFYDNATYADYTQVKNIPHRILTATGYHRIYINAVV
jgi:hypothetical protein